MALFRALESSRPATERLFDDPYAGAFLAFPFRCVLLLARLPGGRTAVVQIIERRWGGPLGRDMKIWEFYRAALARFS